MASSRIRYRMHSPDRQLPISYRPVASSGIVAAVACAFVVGTGGMSTPSYFQQRKECGYQFVQVPIAEGRQVGVRPPTENLKQIRAVFKPSISDMASLLGVSRQTVYNWMAGERPSAESANRIEDLAKAADLVAAHGLNATAYLFTRKVRDGKTLMDIARDGGSAEEAARSLVSTVQHESAQRDLLKNRLSGRQYAKRNNSEFGIPMLEEHIGS